MAKKIGIISDTHSFLDPQVKEVFQDCDEIWHAGDIGDAAVIEELARWKPLRAVYGNIDDQNLRRAYPEDLFWEVEGLSIYMTHIGGKPPRYSKGIKAKIKAAQANIFICGHSHICKVEKDPVLNCLYINPGAAGNHGFHRVKTVLRMTLDQGKISHLEVVELGKRGALV
ncbi:metallophosphoesterase family protein [Penaeicola halotolerans]|uniref:metallophosphoesterase family protein n=1 Tax=Penaeicola halotolerans TaxID=2793196 RepID=UPI001CF8F9EE|nr:metallophosphoesterase family protein [Penaeicola halotolerans]